MIPWIEGIPEDRIRSSLDAFLANASKAYDAIVLDLVAFSRSDIANEAALKSDVVVVTARQNVALFSEVRSTVESAAAGGVPAITTLLNFCQPDPLRIRTLALFSTAQATASTLHGQFTARIRKAGGALLDKLARRFKKKPAAPAADTPEPKEKKP
jgi:Mrp family chromosome partitioning ATPase